MRVLGLDPGYGRLGYGVVEARGSAWRLLEAGVVETPAKTAFEARLLELAEGLRQLVGRHQPSEAALETLFFSKNAKTAMQVAEARGAIRLTLAGLGLAVVEVNPAQVKQALTGSGDAPKAQVSRMVARLLGLQAAPKPDDAADAVALALTALRSQPLRRRLKEVAALKGKRKA